MTDSPSTDEARATCSECGGTGGVLTDEDGHAERDICGSCNGSGRTDEARAGEPRKHCEGCSGSVPEYATQSNAYECRGIVAAGAAAAALDVKQLEIIDSWQAEEDGGLYYRVEDVRALLRLSDDR